MSAHAAASLVTVLAGRSSIGNFLTDEVNAALDDPEVNEELTRFNSMIDIAGDPNRPTQIDVSEAGTLWALSRHDEAQKLTSDACMIDGERMDKSSEGLNAPELNSLGAEESSQTPFAFAEQTITESGSYTAPRGLNAQALPFLFEPNT